MKAQNENQNPQSDVIHAHFKIQKHFKEETNNLPYYLSDLKQKLGYFLSLPPPYGAKPAWTQTAKDLSAKYKTKATEPTSPPGTPVKLKQYRDLLTDIEELDKKCDSIRYQESIYTFKSKDIIERYKEVILKPVKTSFLKEERKAQADSGLEYLVADYRQLLEECFDKEFVDAMFPKSVRCSQLDVSLLKEENAGEEN